MEWGSTAPFWLLADFAAGWSLGWLAVRDRRWALVPGLLVLWGVSRMPALPWRVGAGTVLVPVVVTLCFWLGLVLFFLIFQIP
ncbi:hypothetical protein DEIPH_ctg079orf0003 [Deinococcus phoenicis]|uniref:Uncharacterized protein n=1 Tax=Deinococcus phoenicis TaxID=1476583 RepID=A0A016QKG3_9DEIO|nr:hypothetical protein [Deinococcus phoenicis]EYB66625.1 hypothetical protein DEIPH_ctg079orf0003 [Deinococcus phoenicis]